MSSTPSRISPTAHYTGHVWLKNGLSDPAFATREGERLHMVLAPFMASSRALGGPTIDEMLLARHHLIDQLLERAIEDRTVVQVIEVAAGLSPRGWRMTRRYPQLRYLEADLPGMIAKKREVLARAAAVGAGHETFEIDALADAGPTSIAAIAARLDPARGTAIITEGLLNYFPGPVAIGMWRRFAGALARFPSSLYLADLSLAEDGSTLVSVFRAALGVFVRGGVYLDLTESAARRELLAAGFASAELHEPGERVHIVEART